MALKPGESIGGYRIQRILGAGGMGTVYLAKHPQLPRLNAVKVLNSALTDDAGFRARFEREANLASKLDHPNLISVHDRGEEDGQLWIAMSYIDGTDAAIEVAKGPNVMTTTRALRIITEVGKGLDYAHQRGLLHRDVKPANFLLSGSDHSEERVVLTDFGVARSAEETIQLTQTGTFVATMAYAAPEILLGRHLDHRTDIYALGCALTKLLTGRDAYPSTIPATVMIGHLHEAPPRPSVIRPGLPPAIDAVIAKAMAKDPSGRYNSCRELAAAASDALLGRVAPSGEHYPHSPPAHFAAPGPRHDPRPNRRTGVIAAVAAAAALLATAGIVLALNSGNSAGDTSTAATSTTSRPDETSNPPRTSATRTRSTTTTRTSTATTSTTSPGSSGNAACGPYDSIKADVDAAISVPAPQHSDRVRKYNDIADKIEPAAQQTPPGDVADMLNNAAERARALATRAGEPDATDDELEGLRIQFVDPWVALSFMCL